MQPSVSANLGERENGGGGGWMGRKVVEIKESEWK